MLLVKKINGFGTAIFFKAVVNPYELNKTSVTVMFKKPYNGEDIDYTLNSGSDPGYELFGVIGALTDVVRVLDMLLDEQHHGEAAPFAFAYRYVNHAGGILEFTSHLPGYVIDIDDSMALISNPFLKHIGLAR